jgi:mRNA interferase MazF
MTAEPPSRGEVWPVDLNPTRGHEQAGVRPALVVSVDLFNDGPAGLAVVLPVTSRAKGVPLHVPVNPPEAGLKMRSFIKTEDIRSVSLERLTRRMGQVTTATMAQVEDRLRILLGL